MSKSWGRLKINIGSKIKRNWTRMGSDNVCVILQDKRIAEKEVNYSSLKLVRDKVLTHKKQLYTVEIIISRGIPERKWISEVGQPRVISKGSRLFHLTIKRQIYTDEIIISRSIPERKWIIEVGEPSVSSKGSRLFHLATKINFIQMKYTVEKTLASNRSFLR